MSKIKKFFRLYINLDYLILNMFREWKHPSLFWSIRKYIRHKDPFHYWTKLRLKEEGFCPKCGQLIKKNE